MFAEVQIANVVRYIESLRCENYFPPVELDLARGLGGNYIFQSAAQAMFEREECSKQLEAAFQILTNNLPADHGLYHGVEGILWSVDRQSVFESAEKIGFMYEVNDIALIEEIREHRIKGFDLVTGLTGLLVYAFDRKNAGPNLELVDLITDELTRQATFSSQGVYWQTRRDLYPHLPEYMLGRDSWTDLGMAHGNPGVLAALSKLYLTHRSERLKPIIIDVAGWILSNRQFDQQSSFSFIAEQKCTSKLAWCYGDLSVAISIAWASEALRDNALAGSAAEIALDALRSEELVNRVRTPGVCHGASGIAMICATLSEKLNRDEFTEMKDFWLYKTLGMIASNERSWGKSLLEGDVGAASAMLELMFGIDTSIRRLTLLS